MQPELKITRRHLPHWSCEGSTYFVTARIIAQPLKPNEVCLVLEHIKSGERKFYTLYAVVVLPDHVHLLLCPKEGWALSRIMKGIKGVAARCVNTSRATRGALWQNESFDRIVRDEHELLEKVNYMLMNPVKRGLATDPWQYPGWHMDLSAR